MEVKPTTLSINLFEPGMSLLHRAGLGGLAATLSSLEDRDTIRGQLAALGSWKFDERKVDFSWTDPKQIKPFFQTLYAYAFDLRDGLIHLPGVHEDNGKPKFGNHPEIQAALQRGMSQTILQFGPNRKADGPNRTGKYDVDNNTILYEYQNLVGFTHQSAWEALFDSKERLASQVSIGGTIAPGCAQRHVAHTSTVIEQPPGLAIALHFALVGSVSYVVDYQTAVLVVPDVDNLDTFVENRDCLLPTSMKDCQISNYEDAALQTLIRIRAGKQARQIKSRRCVAIQFATKSWNSKQKTRAAVLDIQLDDSITSKNLQVFQEAVSYFAPRVAKTKAPKKGEESKSFWAKSIVRPLIARNLARNKPWYEGFRDLVVSGVASDEQRSRNLGFESEGISRMSAHLEPDETVFVKSIHEAMKSRFAQIFDENKLNPDVAYRRIDRQRQRWRLSFANAKTPDSVREALADLWSRSDWNPTLRDQWPTLVSRFCQNDRWQLNRDLVLMALACYKGDGDKRVQNNQVNE